MFKRFFSKLRILIKDRGLQNKILFILCALLVFRIFAAIPIPGVNEAALDRFFNSSDFFGLLNIFSGGGLSGLSIVMLGVGPYITASIIMQLAPILSPKMKESFQESGPEGRKKMSQYSRFLSVPLAVIQGFGFLILLQSQQIIPQLTGIELATNILVVTAGSVLLMWVGELISEYGIGNGVSLIIFAGIAASLPSALQQFIFINNDISNLPNILAFIVISIVTVIGVVIVTEAERPIPITYAKQVRSGGRSSSGATTYLPLRLNQSGVMPIIFALSILLLPQMVLQFMSTSNNPAIQDFVRVTSGFLSNQLYYGIAYFVLVFLFTYFYTSVTFDPERVSKNLQQGGAFIPGVRPGGTTTRHISNILSRITFFGAVFLGIIAVLPLIVQSFLPSAGSFSFAIGGTSLLIAVSVIIDLLKKSDGQISLREY